MRLGWTGIVRLALVQTALGAVVVLCTATINRVMIVELGLMALVPAALVGIYHAFQLLRPKWGHRADRSRLRTPWIVGGMALLALGTVGAAAATGLMERAFLPGLALGVASFAMVGLGLGAAATSLLALLATHVARDRKAAAGSLVWILMIAGLAASGITIGQVLDPYSSERLLAVSLCVAAAAVAVTVVALWGVERRLEPAAPRAGADFRAAAMEVWSDRRARSFAIFVFVSMIAYNTQDLILEPFGGHVFGMTPGESTALGGKLHAGALIGMLLVFGGGLSRSLGGPVIGSTRVFMTAGCVGSGLCLVALGMGGLAGPSWPLTANVMALGFCNGVFAVAAIGAMMTLASEGERAREGTRMGVFGAAQATGFALGASLGAASLDGFRALLGGLAESYALVFAAEGLMFLAAAALASGIGRAEEAGTPPPSFQIAGE